MKKTDSRKKSNIVWELFSSVKLTLFLLIILATTSIFGTLIPQQESSREFAQQLNPAVFRLLSSLQLFDMYHSMWFRVLIGLLMLNLIVCSINRFPATLRLFRARPRPDRSQPFENLPPQRSFFVKGELEDIAGHVARLLKESYKKRERKDADKSKFLYGEKGRYSYFGVYLVHLSVLFILVGAIIGSLAGFEASINIVEGETVDSVALAYVRGHKHKELGFSVRCEKFFVDFYDNGSPREYRSDLSFLDNGKVVKKGSLLVNHPMTFRGIRFYQASYGTVPGERVRLKISRYLGGNATKTLEVKTGDPMQLPGNEGKFEVVEAHENLRGMMGPAALISITPLQGEVTRFWIFKSRRLLRERFPKAMLQSPLFNPSAFKPYTFHLDDVMPKYYTGLQVNRDPGVPLVWVGFIMIVIGLFISFFHSHRRVWLRVSKDNGEINIGVAGRANKNSVGMERELDQLTHKLHRLLLPERSTE
jgi:cytochrome c biogenesis protein